VGVLSYLVVALRDLRGQRALGTMVFMSDVRHTDVEVQNPSTLQQRLEAAQRQAAAEVADDEEAVNVEVGEKGTQTGDDSKLWWPVTYQVLPRRRPI
jgi:hypothetical protein